MIPENVFLLKNYLHILFSIFIPVWLGLNCLGIIFYKHKSLSGFLSISLAYGIGMGLTTQIMFVLLSLGQKHSSSLTLLIITLISALISFYAGKNKHNVGVKNKTHMYMIKMRKLDPEAKILFALFSCYFVLLSFIVFWKSLNIPVYTYDAVHFIALKAKVFYYLNDISLIKNMGHPSYPILVPLSETWIASCLGYWDGRFVKIIFPFTFIAIVLVHAYFIEKFTNIKWSIIGSFILCSSVFFIYHASVSYRDLFMLYYFFSSIVLLVLWKTEKNPGFLITSGLLAGLGAFTKLEGSVYLIISTLLLCMLLLKTKDRALIKISHLFSFIIPSALMSVPFYLYKAFLKIPHEKIQVDLSMQNLQRVPYIIKAFLGDMFTSGNWNIIWYMLIISILLNLKRIKDKPEAFYLFCALSLVLGFYFLDGLFTANYEWLGGPGTYTALSRIILHFLPIATSLICVLNYRETKNL